MGKSNPTFHSVPSIAKLRVENVRESSKRERAKTREKGECTVATWRRTGSGIAPVVLPRARDGKKEDWGREAVRAGRIAIKMPRSLSSCVMA